MSETKSRWLPAAVWMLILFASSSTVVFRNSFVGSLASVAAPVASRASVDGFWERYWWLFVKGWHVTEFFVLTLLLVRATRSWGASAALAFGFAISDEFHQTFVAHRGGRWTDVAIDTIGILLAWSVILIHAALMQRSRVPQLGNQSAPKRVDTSHAQRHS